VTLAMRGRLVKGGTAKPIDLRDLKKIAGFQLPVYGDKNHREGEAILAAIQVSPNLCHGRAFTNHFPHLPTFPALE